MRPRRTIDAEALGAFIEQQYQDANVDPDEIDTGALILTGVAVRRRNARTIGELFARQAGKMVAVIAGDSLETVMAAYGSGAVARSIRDKATVMNVDVGGGTSKIAVCVDGKVTELTALDVGARLVCLDPSGRIERVEEAGRRFGAELGISLEPGLHAGARGGTRIGGRHGGARCSRRCAGGSPTAGGAGLLRLDPLSTGAADRRRSRSRAASSEYIYGREATTFGDLGVLLAQEIRDPRRGLGAAGRALERRHPRDRGRRVAIHHAGERQHHLRVAARRLAAAQRAGDRAGLPLDGDEIDSAAVAAAIKAVLKRLDLADGRHAGRGVRAVARLGHLPAARRLLPRRGRRAGGDARRTAIRWCWPATATSAASSAFICARR